MRSLVMNSFVVLAVGPVSLVCCLMKLLTISLHAFFCKLPDKMILCLRINSTAMITIYIMDKDE